MQGWIPADWKGGGKHDFIRLFVSVRVIIFGKVDGKKIIKLDDRFFGSGTKGFN
jgi:hypothetical protein